MNRSKRLPTTTKFLVAMLYNFNFSTAASQNSLKHLGENERITGNRGVD